MHEVLQVFQRGLGFFESSIGVLEVYQKALRLYLTQQCADRVLYRTLQDASP